MLAAVVPLFLWSVFTNPVGRTELLKDGWKDIAKIFVMASVMDLVYQFIAIRQFHPLRAMLVAAVLCFVPYILIRGPVNRIARRKRGLGVDQQRFQKD